jgi:hypothetical protein
MTTAKRIAELKELGLKALNHIPSRPLKDEQFGDLRNALAMMVKEISDGTPKGAVVDEFRNISKVLYEYKPSELSKTNYNRAKVNIVVASSRVKSTHLAAYMAGRYSQSTEIGAKFKCWMHNGAANGAISLYEMLTQIKTEGRFSKASPVVDVVDLFRSSALADASQMLEYARECDQHSVLRQYNAAKLRVYSLESKNRFEGIAMFQNIEAPLNGCHPADISWHIDNFDSFTGDAQLRQIVQTEHATAFDAINKRLSDNKDAALKIKKEYEGKSEHGTMWERESKQNLISFGSFGLAAATTGVYFMSHPEEAMKVASFFGDLLEFLRKVADVHSISDTAISKLGDGGVAGPRMARIVFGDGGVA